MKGMYRDKKRRDRERENEPSRDVLLGDRVETDTFDFGLRRRQDGLTRSSRMYRRVHEEDD